MLRRYLVLALTLAAGGCSTTPSEPVQPTEAPVACTLTPEELSRRREQLLPGLMKRASKVTELENGLRLTIESRSGLLAELGGIVDQERTCCSFLRFQLTAEPGTGPIVFDVTGLPGTLEMLRAL